MTGIIDKAMDELKEKFPGIQVTKDDVGLPHSDIYTFRYLAMEKRVGVPFDMKKPTKEEIMGIVEQVSEAFGE